MPNIKTLALTAVVAIVSVMLYQKALAGKFGLPSLVA